MATDKSEKELKFQNLVEILRWRAEQQPDQPAYTFLPEGDGDTDEVHVTYVELDRQARAVAGWLQSQNAAGERALLLYPSGLEYIAAFMGCLYAGVTAVPAYPPHRNRPMPRLHAIVADAQAKFVLTTSHILLDIEQRVSQEPDLKVLLWQATDILADDLAENWRDAKLNDETLAFLQYTSGSTALPKGVMVSQGNLMANERMIQKAMGLGADTTVVGWLPPYHDMGLIGNILQPLYVGAPYVFMAPVVFLKKPFRWLQAISKYRGHACGGPNFAYDMCVQKTTPEQREALDLSSWGVAYNGSEPIKRETLDRFVEAFQPYGFRRETFFPCYGLAETTLITSGGPKTAQPVYRVFQKSGLEDNRVVEVTVEDGNAQMLVGSGQAVIDQEIVIAHPESLTKCRPDEIGEIWVKGANVAQGYWQRPDETKQYFGAHLADTGEGPFLRTGDLGFLKDGELFVTGRLKDLIIVAGRNHYPQDIELTSERSHPSLRQGCCAAFTIEENGTERLIVVQEVKRESYRKLDKDDVVGAIRQAVAEEHELRVHEVYLIKPGAMPKTSSGKIQRRLCRKQLLAGELVFLSDGKKAEVVR